MKIEALGQIFRKTNDPINSRDLANYYLGRAKDLRKELLESDMRFAMAHDLEKIDTDGNWLIAIDRPMPTSEFSSRALLIELMYEVFESRYFQLLKTGGKKSDARNEAYVLAAQLIAIANIFLIPDKSAGIGSKSKSGAQDKYLGKLRAVRNDLDIINRKIEKGDDTIPAIVLLNVSRALTEVEQSIINLEHFASRFAKSSKQAVTKSDHELYMFDGLVGIFGGDEKAKVAATKVVNALVSDLKKNRFNLGSGSIGWRQRINVKRKSMETQSRKKAGRSR